MRSVADAIHVAGNVHMDVARRTAVRARLGCSICELTALAHLDVSSNKLVALPPTLTSLQCLASVRPASGPRLAAVGQCHTMPGQCHACPG